MGVPWCTLRSTSYSEDEVGSVLVRWNAKGWSLSSLASVAQPQESTRCPFYVVTSRHEGPS